MKKILCFLLCAVMLCALCACGNDGTGVPASHSDVPTQRQIEKWAKEAEEAKAEAEKQAAETASVTPVPENPAAAERDMETVLQVENAEGGFSTMHVELLSGTFRGGPSISMYGEKDSTWSQTEAGGFIFALPGVGPESACSMELRFLPGKTADELAPGLLDEFDDIRSMEDTGTVILAGRGMRCVKGVGENMDWTAWITDLPEGAVAFVQCAYPEAENAALRMQACLDTLELVSNY